MKDSRDTQEIDAARIQAALRQPMPAKLSAQDLAAIRQRRAEASGEINALESGRAWRQTIPVREDNSAEIILASLGDIQKLLGHIEVSQDELEKLGGYSAFLSSCAKSGEQPETYEWYLEKSKEGR